MATYRTVESSEFLKIMSGEFGERIVSSREMHEARAKYMIKPINWVKIDEY